MSNTDQKTRNEIKNGNIQVFESMFRNFYAPLCGYALKLLKDASLAEETVQEVFYILWKNRKTLNIQISVKSYLYRAVYNKCLHYINHQTVVNKHAEWYKHINNESFQPETAMEQTEMYEAYKKTLNQLPERCREVFQLSRKYGLKYHEIAEKLSISVKTVEANMGKALKAFKHNLTEYFTYE